LKAAVQFTKMKTGDCQHMGETPMRLRSVTDLMVSGENKWGEFSLSLFIGSHFIIARKENKNISFALYAGFPPLRAF
jgi:hypothetical protein